MPDQLKGRVAIVTGASRGIGKEIAALFAAEGARSSPPPAPSTPATTSSPAALDETIAEARAAGGEATAVRADISAPGEHRAPGRDRARARTGRSTCSSTTPRSPTTSPIKDFPLAPLAADARRRPHGAVAPLPGRDPGHARRRPRPHRQHLLAAPPSTPSRRSSARAAAPPTASSRPASSASPSGLAHELFENNIAVNALSPDRRRRLARRPLPQAHRERRRPARRARRVHGPRRPHPRHRRPEELTGQITYSQPLLKQHGQL